ncbi:MAG: rod shape-determining protein MreC [Leptospiraceae bacterium]|nr:rod shape-determining protein MreC [Leptospiraceae bacterium]
MLWSRINNYKEFFSLLFCILFSIGSLVWNSSFVVRAVTSSQVISNAVSSSFDSLGKGVKKFFNSFESTEQIKEERDKYAKIIEEYKVLPLDIVRLRQENESLRQELNFRPQIDYPQIKAEVLSVRLNSIYRTIIIDKGKDAAIQPYMPVVARAVDDSGLVIMAVVGKVIAVSGSSSVVQPIINSNFTMGVRIEGGNNWATLSGNSGRGTEAILTFIYSDVVINPKLFSGSHNVFPSTLEESLEESYSKIGKAVYSSGGAGLFPKDIPVGVIAEEGPRTGSFKTAFMKPYVKFEELEFVTVIKKLPSMWAEEWPLEKGVVIENPFFGELDFPSEKEELVPKNKKVKNKKKKKKQKKELEIEDSENSDNEE